MKVALVTGAARGIGLATTKRFLREGWHVIMVDIDDAALQDAGEGLERVDLVTADISDEVEISNLQRFTEGKFGKLDALVNNAGVADFGPIQDTSFATWRKIMNTNLDGPFLMVQTFTGLLAKASGAVVNITSISGHRASTLRVAYGTSKAALAHLTQQQAVELGELHIRVNAVAPGPVDTKLALAVHSPEIRKAYHDTIALNRYGKEEEIANGIYFLCSDEASYVTGQILSIDGGFQAAGIGVAALRSE